MRTRPARIIIEGLDFAKPKEIALALSKSPGFIGQNEDHRFTSVISAKWGNFRDFPWGKGLIDFVPDEANQVMKNYGVWVRLIELQLHYNWIIDRFHITTQQYQLHTHNFACDFKWLEERFLKLGFHLVHTTLNETALQERVLRQNNDNGIPNIEEIFQLQNIAQEIVSNSILPHIELDISNLNIQATVANITDWYEEVYSYTPTDDHQSDRIFLPSCS